MKTLNRVTKQDSTAPKMEQAAQELRIARKSTTTEPWDNPIHLMESLPEKDKPDELELHLIRRELERASELPLDQASVELEVLYLVIKDNPRLRIVADSLRKLVEAENFLYCLSGRIERM